MRLRDVTRVRALVALLLLGGGIGLFALVEGWLDLDGYQAEKAVARLQISLRTVSPGLATGIVAWVLALVVLVRLSRWAGFSVALLLPMVLIVTNIIAGPFLHFDPVTATSADASALSQTIWSGVVMSGLMLSLCFLPGDSPARPARAGDMPEATV